MSMDKLYNCQQSAVHLVKTQAREGVIDCWRFIVYAMPLA